MNWNIFEAGYVLVMIGLGSVMGWLCGMFSYLLDYCFWAGNIFSGYLPWLADHLVRRRDPKTWADIRVMAAYSGSWHEEMTAAAGGYGWYKVLGGCAVCLNVHIAMWSWVVIAIFTPMEWYYGFPYVLMSSYTIRRLVGAVY